MLSSFLLFWAGLLALILFLIGFLLKSLSSIGVHLYDTVSTVIAIAIICGVILLISLTLKFIIPPIVDFVLGNGSFWGVMGYGILALIILGIGVPLGQFAGSLILIVLHLVTFALITLSGLFELAGTKCDQGCFFLLNFCRNAVLGKRSHKT